jgi:hypothetical protein
MVLLTSPIGKARRAVDAFVLLGNPAQESCVLNVGPVALGFRPANTEVEHRFHFSSTNPQVLEASSQEGDRRHVPLQWVLGGDLGKYEVGRDHVMYV